LLACRNYLVIERYAVYIGTLPFDTYNPPATKLKCFQLILGLEVVKPVGKRPMFQRVWHLEWILYSYTPNIY